MTLILEARDLLVQRAGITVLEVDNLSIEEGEVLAVIGPNGAGKSTLLLSLSYLLKPERGQVLFRGQPIGAKVELAYRRQIGLVLQEPLLMDVSVFDNVAMGLRFRGLPRDEIKARVEQWLERLGVSRLRNRPASRLSGGEAQRVSLARAFALQPEVLMLDEPFSALDAPTRIRLLEDFHALLVQTSLTTIFVTHDLDEALFLGNRVAVLLNGNLRQSGPPQQVFSAPADSDVASFVGMETVIAGQVVALRDEYMVVEADGLRLEATGISGSGQPGSSGNLPIGQKVLLCLRPEDITLWPDGAPFPNSLYSFKEDTNADGVRNRLNGRVLRLIPQGPVVRVVIDCGFQLVALITRASVQEMKLVEGKAVSATFTPAAAHLIPRPE
jgi:tungstate transport system ATP-binding protein